MSRVETEDVPYGDVPVEPGPDTIRFRRLVTGLDEQGRSVVLEDGPSPHRQTVAGVPSFVQTEFWRHDEVPVDNSGAPDDKVSSPITITPPAGGSVFRVLEIPPDSDWDHQDGYKERMTHATPSLDYAIVTEGEVWSVMDGNEVLMRAGDVLVQRGTNHAWSNRTDKRAVIYFILIGGTLAS